MIGVALTPAGHYRPQALIRLTSGERIVSDPVGACRDIGMVSPAECTLLPAIWKSERVYETSLEVPVPFQQKAELHLAERRRRFQSYVDLEAAGRLHHCGAM